MRNSSLVKIVCAENLSGLKPGTEDADYEVTRYLIVVGERSALGRRSTVRNSGRCRSENAGISSDLRE